MEEIGELIGKGFGIWKRNLNLCIPYIFSSLASILIIMAFAMAMLVVALPLMERDWASFLSLERLGEAGAADEIYARMVASLMDLDWQSYMPIFILILGMILLLSLAGSYFNAGAIGMARQALEEGRSATSSLWSAGRRHFWNMFLLTLLIGLIVMAGMIFLLPGIEQIVVNPPDSQQSAEGLGLVLAGGAIFIIYALLLSIIFSPAPYALVLEGLGPVAAVKAGIEFFLNNKFDVLILWLVVAALSLVLQMIGSSFSAGDAVTYQPLSVIVTLADLLVLVPLANLWWTRLYMIRMRMLKEEEVKDPW